MENKENYILGDLYDQARNAYNWVSFNPERRAEQTVKDYSEELTEDLLTIENPETKEAYKTKYRKYLCAWLSAQSRCASSAVTGPANFPVERMRKRNESERNKYEAFRKFRERFFKAMNRKPKEVKDHGGKENETFKFEHGEVILNYSIDRVQIRHESKPEPEKITELKKNGFKWSPSQKVWQRQLTLNGKIATSRLTGIKL